MCRCKSHATVLETCSGENEQVFPTQDQQYNEQFKVEPVGSYSALSLNHLNCSAFFEPVLIP